MSWCIKNGIKIYVELEGYNKLKIIINDNNRIQVSREVYKQNNFKNGDQFYWLVVYNLYINIFKMMNNEKN